jgi:hypothetical protein
MLNGISWYFIQCNLMRDFTESFWLRSGTRNSAVIKWKDHKCWQRYQKFEYTCEATLRSSRKRTQTFSPVLQLCPRPRGWFGLRPQRTGFALEQEVVSLPSGKTAERPAGDRNPINSGSCGEESVLLLGDTDGCQSFMLHRSYRGGRGSESATTPWFPALV